MTSDKITSSARYEIKFSTNNAHFEYLKQWVNIHPMCFTSPYPDRQVNNIYFDTFDLDSYLENMAGISSRTKLRLRWYGETQMINNPKLELKIKRNKLGWKKAVPIDIHSSLSDISLDSIRESIYRDLEDDMSSRLKQSDNAVLLNSYERCYFESQDRKVRVTIDRKLKFYDQRLHLRPNNIFPANAPEIVIMEVKTAAKDVDLAAKILESFPIPQTKSSKYVIGVQSILGY